MKKIRKIAVVTGSRAEYGLLYWLLKEIEQDDELELQLIVTCMHLSSECGYTYKYIEEDGFKITKKIEMLLASDTASSITKSMGLELIGFADAYNELKPDIVLVLGDRYEILIAVVAATMARIPVAHIHGGEVTKGVIDENIRHAISKMSHIHFVAAKPYAKRLKQLGESPDKIYNFGAPGLDHITKTELLSKEEIEKVLGIKFNKKTFLVTFHPETLSKKPIKEEVETFLSALDSFKDVFIIFTYPNKETESAEIIDHIEQFVKNNPNKSKCYISLGFKNYLSVVKQVDVVVGNSSSGLIEIPFLKVPSVNVGRRQEGRLEASSVITIPLEKQAIIDGINKAQSKEFKDALKDIKSPYGSGDASKKIKDVLKEIDLSNILYKDFYEPKI